MERHSSLLDRAINVTNWNNGADLYMKRYMGLFNNNNHNGEKIPMKMKKTKWPPVGIMSHPL